MGLDRFVEVGREVFHDVEVGTVLGLAAVLDPGLDFGLDPGLDSGLDSGLPSPSLRAYPCQVAEIKDTIMSHLGTHAFRLLFGDQVTGLGRKESSHASLLCPSPLSPA